MQQVVVVGGGGFGREVLDVVEAINRSQGVPTFEVRGVIDDHLGGEGSERLAARGYRHLGGLREWLADGTIANYVVAIGDPGIRTRVCSLLEKYPTMEPLTIVHPSSVLGSMVRLGLGSVVCAGVQISTNVEIGNHVHINPGAIIGHDAVLADFVSINPGAIVSGNVTLEKSSLVGAGAIVLQGLTVGTGSTVGAGSVVTRHVAQDVIVKGVPAR